MTTKIERVVDRHIARYEKERARALKSHAIAKTRCDDAFLEVYTSSRADTVGDTFHDAEIRAIRRQGADVHMELVAAIGGHHYRLEIKDAEVEGRLPGRKVVAREIDWIEFFRTRSPRVGRVVFRTHGDVPLLDLRFSHVSLTRQRPEPRRKR